MTSRNGANSVTQQPDGRLPAGLGGLHVAIIMDGNGRWAKQRGLPRAFGHRAGVQALRRTIQAAPNLGIAAMTVYGFSTENWRRPAAEVSELMGLLKAYVASDLEQLADEGVRVKIIGRREGLPADILQIIEKAESRTADNTRFCLQVAFNYGGQADIVDAARRMAAAVERGQMTAADVDEAAFGAMLSTAQAPPLDLVIRTSGEQRLSNFLLWESAYAELIFQDVLWPDYGPAELAAAVHEFSGRERRYGGSSVDVHAAG
jgi:undecaprenyl diphosphate synthase